MRGREGGRRILCITTPSAEGSGRQERGRCEAEPREVLIISGDHSNTCNSIRHVNSTTYINTPTA